MSEEKSKRIPASAAKGTVREKLKLAFAVKTDTEPLTDDDIALLDKAAGFLRRRRLKLPAVMALEVLTPISFLSSQAMVVLEPLLGPFFPREDYARVIKILSRRDGVKIFIERIEIASDNAPKTEKQKP